MGKKYLAPDGWTLQAFQFALDATDEQRAVLARQFGGRRAAFNWTVETLKADIDAYNAGVESTDAAPSFYGMRARWNQEKHARCVDRETGEVWWPEVSKEAFADGVRGAVDAYWRWQKSRRGELKGKRVGFPRFKRKGRDSDRYTISTGSFGLVGRRHVQIPRVGVVRLHENARRLERLMGLDRARVLAMTVRRHGDRLLVTLRVEVQRPQADHQPTHPESCVGVDVGTRRLATVANDKGEVVEVVENPRALIKNLAELRRLNRQRSRRKKGSSRYRETNRRIAKLHAHVRNTRQHHIHVLTTRLAKTHGRIVVEGMDVSAMLKQKGLPGARARRRGLADAAMAEPRRQLRYKCVWYGSDLVEADRWFPSSKTCHCCGHGQDIGWSENWAYQRCGAAHQRDDNAAINLARWPTPVSDLGPVGAPVKQGAVRKTRLGRAGGEDLRKHASDTAVVQPREGVRVP